MTKKACLLTAAIIFSCGVSMNATPAFKQSAPTPRVVAPAFAWNFVYAFGGGPIPGLTWSGDYLYISSGSYLVYSANGYGFLTPSTPVYCSAVSNANTYVEVSEMGGSGSGRPSYYDFYESSFK